MYTSTGGIQDALGKLGGVAGTAVHILDDPALPAVLKHINNLHKIEQKRPSTTKRTASGEVPGVGLAKLAVPLGAFVFFRQNPSLGWALLAGIVAIPVFVGYTLGRR
jgi:hypothetical protein